VSAGVPFAASAEHSEFESGCTVADAGATANRRTAAASDRIKST
jgi:hypothetical protein